MTVSDLDLVHHPASIEGGIIVVEGYLMFTPADFVFADLKIVNYSEEEEKELQRLGILANIPRSWGRA